MEGAAPEHGTGQQAVLAKNGPRGNVDRPAGRHRRQRLDILAVRLKRLCEAFGVTLHFVPKYLHEAELPSESYDRVFSISVMEHASAQIIARTSKEIGASSNQADSSSGRSICSSTVIPSPMRCRTSGVRMSRYAIWSMPQVYNWYKGIVANYMVTRSSTFTRSVGRLMDHPTPRSLTTDVL